MIQVKDVLGWLDARAPFRYAESWDRSGLQVGSPDMAVERVLIALDPSGATFQEAAEYGCQCLVTHHPLIFRAISEVRADKYPGNLIIRALQNHINLIAAHTNLDSAADGTNDILASLIPFESVNPLEVNAAHKGQDRYIGMGRIGVLRQPINLMELISHLTSTIDPGGVRVVGSPERKLHKVAICTGSGGSLLELAINSGADVYITGDIKYHEAQRALEGGLALIDLGHFASETLVLPPIAEYLRSQARCHDTQFEVIISQKEKDPFWRP